MQKVLNYVANNMDFMLGTQKSVPEEQKGISLILTRLRFFLEFQVLSGADGPKSKYYPIVAERRINQQ
jgi:hypothetical protein